MKQFNQDTYLGNGLNFPIQTDSRGQIKLVTGDENISQSIRIILETYPGERVMRPGFGCRVRDLLFSPRSEETLTLISTYVREALEMWEPRIRVVSVESDYGADSDGAVFCQINYEIPSTHNTRSLVFPFYIEQEQEIE